MPRPLLRLDRYVLRALCVWFVLVAAEGAAQERVVVLDLQSEKALESQARTLTEVLLTELARPNTYALIGSSDVAAMIGRERQLQLLGCSEAAQSCLAEISGALGARYLVAGSLGRVGRERRLDIRLIDTEKARVLFRDGASGDEERLVEEIQRMSPRLLAALDEELSARGVLKKAPEEPAVAAVDEVGTTDGPSRVPAFIALGAGAASATAGAFFIANALSFNTEKLELSATAAAERRSAALTSQTVGYSLAAAGLAGIIAGGVMWATAGSDDDSESVDAEAMLLIRPDGAAAVAVGGRF